MAEKETGDPAKGGVPPPLPPPTPPPPPPPPPLARTSAATSMDVDDSTDAEMAARTMAYIKKMLEANIAKLKEGLADKMLLYDAIQRSRAGGEKD
jgi:hypothetical protein